MSLRLGFFTLTGAGKHHKVVEEEPAGSRQSETNHIGGNVVTQLRVDI